MYSRIQQSQLRRNVEGVLYKPFTLEFGQYFTRGAMLSLKNTNSYLDAPFKA